MSLLKFVKQITPPILIPGLNRLWFFFGRRFSRPPDQLRLTGSYQVWADALADSIGYDDHQILDKTANALRKVKVGDAIFERDSVLFDEVQYNWPVLAGLMWVAAKNKGRLSVLDFGGSLGSTYFQNRAFLDSLGEVRWNIVEQSSHVAIGRSEFQDHRLRFFDSLDDFLASHDPDVILLAGVLQYIEEPYKILDALRASSATHLIIDRTPNWGGATDYLCVQHVPEYIYRASYPSWIFSKDRLSAKLRLDWTIISEFQNDDSLPGPVKFSYQGLIAIRSNGDRFEGV